MIIQILSMHSVLFACAWITGNDNSVLCLNWESLLMLWLNRVRLVGSACLNFTQEMIAFLSSSFFILYLKLKKIKYPNGLFWIKNMVKFYQHRKIFKMKRSRKEVMVTITYGLFYSESRKSTSKFRLDWKKFSF